METDHFRYRPKSLPYQDNQSAPCISNQDVLDTSQPDQPVIEYTPTVLLSEPLVTATTSREISTTQSEEHNIDKFVTKSPVRSLGTTRPYATASDWANHRSLITAMYRDQNKALKETKQIMEDKYNFFAT